MTETHCKAIEIKIYKKIKVGKISNLYFWYELKVEKNKKEGCIDKILKTKNRTL